LETPRSQTLRALRAPSHGLQRLYGLEGHALTDSTPQGSAIQDTGVGGEEGPNPVAQHHYLQQLRVLKLKPRRDRNQVYLHSHHDFSSVRRPHIDPASPVRAGTASPPQVSTASPASRASPPSLARSRAASLPASCAAARGIQVPRDFKLNPVMPSKASSHRVWAHFPACFFDDWTLAVHPGPRSLQTEIPE